jgi:hypothetical protein
MNLKTQTVQRDFESFVHEVVTRVRDGKSKQQIEKWIRHRANNRNGRMVVGAVDCDSVDSGLELALGVTIAPSIEWVEEKGELVGFNIRGTVCRESSSDPAESDPNGQIYASTTSSSSSRRAF